MEGTYSGKRERVTPEMEAYTREHHTTCICGGAGWYRVDAWPGDKWFGVAMPCLCKLDDVVKAKAARLLNKSAMTPAEIARWTLDSFIPKLAKVLPGYSVEDVARVLQLCKRFARQPRGHLILTGWYGVGKSHLAFGIAGACLARGMAVYAATVPDMLDMLRESMKAEKLDEFMQDLKTMDVLVLDDLGVEKESDWAREKLFQIVDYRYRNHRPMVITTNQDVALLRAENRLFSRLCEGADVEGGESVLIQMPCGDFRPGKAGK